MSRPSSGTRRRKPLWITATVLVSVLVISGGCDLIRSAAVYTAPKTEKIAPEYNRLPGKKVLIYVWVPPEIKWDYPYIRLDLSGYVGAYLKEQVKDVTTVDPRQVELYLEKQNDPQLDPAALGNRFQTDDVIQLSVHRFSLRDPGMAHFYRGRIAAAVTVYDLATNSQAPERFPLKDVEVTYPSEQGLGFANAQPAQVMRATCEAFAVEVGRKFHTWEKSLD